MKNAIESQAEVSVIKTLLDPQYNPQGPTLMDQGLLEVAFNRVFQYEDPDGKSKAILLALLDPQVNTRTQTLAVTRTMLQYAAFNTPKEDILKKLLDHPTINLTDEET